MGEEYIDLEEVAGQELTRQQAAALGFRHIRPGGNGETSSEKPDDAQ
jgi:hypothetical protein